MSEGERIEDASLSAADIMNAKDSHGMVEATYRPMRGQAYVEFVEEKRSIIVQRDEAADKVHRGRVMALGPPARLGDREDAPEVPWDLRVGDVVAFELFVWMDRMRIFGMHGARVAVVAQGEIVGVYGE